MTVEHRLAYSPGNYAVETPKVLMDPVGDARYSPMYYGGNSSNDGTTISMSARPSAIGQNVDVRKRVLPFLRVLRVTIYAYHHRGPRLVFGPTTTNIDHAASASNLKSTELAMLRVLRQLVLRPYKSFTKTELPFSCSPLHGRATALYSTHLGPTPCPR